MSTEAERAERLRRLQERRAGAPQRAASRGQEPPPTAPVGDGGVPAPGPRAAAGNRRRRAAPAGRVLAAGLSATAFFGGVAALGAATKASSTGDAGTAAWSTGDPGATPSPTTPVSTTVPVPATVVVVEEVHHPVYVDQHGNPIGGPSTVAATGARKTSRGSPSTVSSAPTAAPAPAAPAPVATTPPPPPPPVCSGSTC
jgi:hypothetical protein